MLIGFAREFHSCNGNRATPSSTAAGSTSRKFSLVLRSLVKLQEAVPGCQKTVWLALKPPPVKRTPPLARAQNSSLVIEVKIVFCELAPFSIVRKKRANRVLENLWH